MNPIATNQPPHLLPAAKKPRIPDHEVLRCIGRGSYGEVWLARAVTGVFRAVKVVRREDFELDRTFEREFQGILKFEPVSRDHPGLVDILHVGRNEEEGFYYYVMELGDDREIGARINPVDYEPRTLGTDRVAKKRLPLEEVLEIGMHLAGALQHLHETGLSHRDIKPSNIIFCQGRAKLADIGLVAQTGQRTFVGTEGFVPPEGPGSPAADIFSLGMVLYEISTGKDRLHFPELADDPGPAEEKNRRHMLNEVICKACDPNPRRRFASGKSLAEALRAVRRGRYHRALLPRAGLLLAASGVLAFSVVWARNGRMPWPPGNFLVSQTAARASSLQSPHKPPVSARIRIDSQPPGAQVLDHGNVLGRTPLELNNLPVGSVRYALHLDHYLDQALELNLTEGLNPLSVTQMHPALPEKGESWQNSLGMQFKPDGEWHASVTPVGYDEFLKVVGYVPDDVVDGNAVRVSPANAQNFCERLRDLDLKAEMLDPELHYYRPHAVQLAGVDPPPEEVRDHVVFYCLLQRREFGDLVIHSEPAGAAIFQGDRQIGETPFSLFHQPTGPVEYVVRKPGFEDLVIRGDLKSRQQLNLNAALVKSRKAALGAPYENSLTMKFVPVPTLPTVLVSVWETRVRDYDAFTAATKRERHTVSWEPGPEHPVAKVSREEGVQFCKWLSEKEHAEGLLPAHLEYRLPTDEEWSLAAGLPENKSVALAERGTSARANYVWGVASWPPPKGKDLMPGNFSDLSRLKGDRDAKLEKTLGVYKYADGGKYDDGFAYTAPVGSFQPNPFGLFDLAGNVAEWVADNYGGENPALANMGVTRGGSWDDWEQKMLRAASRRALPFDLRDGLYGFRCIIGRIRE